jgi:NAD(P)-dependent dehydrogenase (short-subunit alcohol dehydrogenase family)
MDEGRMFRWSWLFRIAASATALAVKSSPTSVPKNVIVVGGSSGMGKALALEVVQHGGRVLLCSRNPAKLDLTRAFLLQRVKSTVLSSTSGETSGGCVTMVETHVVDATDEASVQALADGLATDTWDALVVTAADQAVHGPMLTLPVEDVRRMMETKFWSAYYCAKYVAPKLVEGGAVVFCSGILGRRPGLNCVPLAICNGALEGLTRALALEWGPRLRVNCLSPGFCDTERFDRMDPLRKQSMLDNTAASLPLQRVGQPVDMGQALYYLATASFVTGVVLDVDGGHSIRQYANQGSDPMRQR